MSRPRKEPTLTHKLAAVLRELLEIPMEHAEKMSAEQIISLVTFDHIRHHALFKHEPWVDEHFNLDPLLRGGHKYKTAKVDQPQIAKTKRLSKSQEEFRRNLLTPRDQRPPKQSKWGKRPFPNRSKQK